MDAKNQQILNIFLKYFCGNSMDAKNQQILNIFLASVLWTPLYHCVMPVFGRICITHIGLTLEIFCGVCRYSIKKVHNILLYDAEQFYVKNKMATE